MAKAFGFGRCVHCLKSFDKLTSDHVFPQAWFPSTIPDNLEKWQVPSCLECNSLYGKIENDLLVLIGPCLDPKEPRSDGIAAKASRATNPSFGKNKHDRLHPMKKRERIFKNLIPGTIVPIESFLPNFGPNDQPNRNIGILVPVDKLTRFGEKVVRGLTYVLDHGYIESDHQVTIIFEPKDNVRLLIDAVKQFGHKYQCGPGIRVRRAVVPEDPQCGLFDVEIWGRICFYATVRQLQLADKQQLPHYRQNQGSG